jgi:hypothetical protein
MDRGFEEIEPGHQVAGDLAQYRRLVDLQKQMVALAKQNKMAEQHCAALRERVGSEVVARRKKRASLGQMLRHKVKTVLKVLPGFTGTEAPNRFLPPGSFDRGDLGAGNVI